MSDDLPVLDELERRLIAGCYGTPGSDRDRQRRVRPYWTWIVAGISGAACIAAVVGAVLLASRSVEPSAALALDRAAAAAASGPGAPLPPGKYWYTRTVDSTRLPIPIVPTAGPPPSGSAPATVAFDVRQRLETWIGMDGTIRQRDTIISDRFASPAGRKRWLATGQAPPPLSGSDSITAGDGWFPPQSGSLGDLGDGLFSYSQLVSLPTSVPKLRSAIERAQAALQWRDQHGLNIQPRHGAGVAGMQILQSGTGPSAVDRRAIEDLHTIASLLETPVTASVRGALFRVAASLPGVAYDGPARDPLGRKGMAVSLGNGQFEMRMIFDPHTGVLLASSLSPGGTVRSLGYGGSTETIIAQGVASSIDSLPGGLKPVGSTVPPPATISISPRSGATNTSFLLRLSAPAGTSTRASAPQAIAVLNGPTAPGCRSYLLPPPIAHLRDGTVTSAHGKVTYRYRLAATAIGRRRWCAGRYLLQVGAENQARLYFDVR